MDWLSGLADPVCDPSSYPSPPTVQDPTDHQEAAYVDPKWFDGLEEGVPVEHPLKVDREPCRFDFSLRLCSICV